MTFYDATLPLKTGMATFPGDPSFSLVPHCERKKGDPFDLARISMGTHTGTHVDPPAHYLECGSTVDQIPLGPRNSPYLGQIWTLGPLARTVMDAALYLDCTSGPDPADPDSLLMPATSFLACLRRQTGKLRLGFSPHLGYAQVQKEVMALAQKALAVFQDMGHEVEIWEESIPDVGDTWSDLMAMDLYSQLKEVLDRLRPDLGRTLVAALDTARKLSLDDFAEHQKARCQLQLKLTDFFSGHDLLLTPAMPTEAFDANGPPPAEIGGVPIPLLGAVAFTYPFNLSGNPAASVRTGLTPSGLPAGLQIVGPKHRDALVLQLAHDFEQASPWNDQWPTVSSQCPG